MFRTNDGELMNGVRIKRDELLGVLKANLTKHKEDVSEANELRDAEVLEYFSSEVTKMTGDEHYAVKESFSFRKPVDSSKDYEKAIRMASMTQDDIIELSESQFDKLVMDNWQWKETLISTSSLYGKLI